MAAVYVYDQFAAVARTILVSNSLSYDFCTSHVPSLIDSGVSSSFLASFLSTWQCSPSSCQDPPLGAGLCTPPYFLSVGDHTLSVWFTTTTLFFLTDLQLHTSLHPSPCRLFKVTAYLHRFTVTFNDRDNRGCILCLLYRLQGSKWYSSRCILWVAMQKVLTLFCKIVHRFTEGSTGSKFVAAS